SLLDQVQACQAASHLHRDSHAAAAPRPAGGGRSPPPRPPPPMPSRLAVASPGALLRTPRPHGDAGAGGGSGRRAPAARPSRVPAAASQQGAGALLGGSAVVGTLATARRWRRRAPRRGGARSARGRVACTAVAAPLAKTRPRGEDTDGAEDEEDELDELDELDEFDAWKSRQKQYPLWVGINDTMVDFGGLQIPACLMTALEERGIVHPSQVQCSVMSRIASGEQVVIDAPTGYGKTLAVLLPLMARLQPTMHKGIQALVVVPTPELALQFGRELRWLFSVLGGEEQMCWFNPAVPTDMGMHVLTSGKGVYPAMRKDNAIWVTTPGVLNKEFRLLRGTDGEVRLPSPRWEEALQYYLASNLHMVVLDEIDLLVAPKPRTRGDAPPPELPEFRSPCERLLGEVMDQVRTRYRNHPVQIIGASASANSWMVYDMLERLAKAKWRKKRDAARRVMPSFVQCAVDTASPEPASEQEEPSRPAKRGAPLGICHAVARLDVDQTSLLEDTFNVGRLELMVNIVDKLKGSIMVLIPRQIKLDGVLNILREAGHEHAAKFKVKVGLGLDDVAAAFDFGRKNPGVAEPEAEAIKYEACRDRDFTETLDMGDMMHEAAENGEPLLLVAQDHTMRGVHVPNVDYVVLVRMPKDVNSYLHLSGRTGRAGRGGTVVTIADDLGDRERMVLFERDAANVKFVEWNVDEGTPGDVFLPADEALEAR
ncbi:unnamed protein product, partial [Prorocentrum cordatum]